MKTAAERIVLIPCYRPGRNLSRLVIRLNEMNIRVILINDGSGTEYDAIFRNLSFFAAVLHHKEQLGRGAALITGLEHIRKNYCSTGDETMTQTSSRNITVAADLEIYDSPSSDSEGIYSPQRIESIISMSEYSPGKLLVSKGEKKNRSGLFEKLRMKKRVEEFCDSLWAFDGKMIGTMITSGTRKGSTEANILSGLMRNKISVRKISLPDRPASFSAGRYCYG